MCSNASTNNEFQYLTQETSCIGHAPFKCQCLNGKYFNKEKDHYKCETLLEFNESCSQTNSCRNIFCIGNPKSKSDCLPFQYFDITYQYCKYICFINHNSNIINSFILSQFINCNCSHRVFLIAGLWLFFLFCVETKTTTTLFKFLNFVFL